MRRSGTLLPSGASNFCAIAAPTEPCFSISWAMQQIPRSAV